MTLSAATGGQRDAEPTVIVGSVHGTVTGLAVRTGAVLWHLTTGPRLGTLADDGAVVCVPTTIPLAAPRMFDLPGHPYRARINGHPALLTAIRAQDGALLWQKDGWRTDSNSHLALDSGLLIGDMPASEIGGTSVSAIDPNSGETRWTHDTGSPLGIGRRLIAARGGRAYVWEERDTRYLRALDARTGAVAWSLERPNPYVLPSEGGKLVIAGETRAPAGHVERTVRATEDGAIVATIPGYEYPLALTDDGIIYLPRLPLALAAQRVGEGVELWRAKDVEPRHLIVAGDVLYCAWLTQPQQLAVVVALDARTGQQIWHWHSPAHIASLLKLWGRRTPRVLVFALSQAHRSLRRARDYPHHGIFNHEVLHGQWRRPASLLGDFSLAAGWGTVFVATSMGLFALRANDGRLLWHALPTRNLSWNTPAVAPP